MSAAVSQVAGSKGFVGGDLTEKEIANYLALPEERLLLAKRQHWFVLVGPIFATAVSVILLLYLLFFVFAVLLESWIVFIALGLFIIAFALTLISKAVVDWYYHFYIITSRKILEICCVPFFSDSINDVFLDQVRTTEVEAVVPTVLHEIMDMGSVVVAFDRPSHDRVFILSNISQPREISIYLGDTLESIMQGTTVWLKPRNELEEKHHPDAVRLSEDIIRLPEIRRNNS